MAKKSKTPIKIVQIIAESGLSGGPTHVLGLLRNIDKEKFENYLISPAGHLSDEAKKISGVEVINIAMGSKFDYWSVRKIRQAIQQIRADDWPFAPFIVHAHGPRAGLLGRWAASGDVMTVYTEHRWDEDFHLKNKLNEWLQLKLLKYLNYKSNRIVAVSSSVEKFLVENDLAPKKRVELIPNAIEAHSHKQKINAEKMRLHHPPIVGTVGNLVQEKGQEYLVRAMEHVVERHPHAMLEIIGEGPERIRLEGLTKALGLEKNITLLGRQEDPAEFMKHWDLFVLPSVAETFGIVILEAYEAGLPVVATNIGGVPDIIKDGKSGILVKPRSRSSLSKAVLEIIERPAHAAELRRGGYKRAKDFAWGKIIKDIEKLYLEVGEGRD